MLIFICLVFVVMNFAAFEIKSFRKNKVSDVKIAAGIWHLHPQEKGKKSSRPKDPSGIFDIYETGEIDLWMSWNGKKKYRRLNTLRSRDSSLQGDMWEAIGKGDKGNLYFDLDFKRVGISEEYPDSIDPGEVCKNVKKVCELPESYFSEFETFASLPVKNVGFLEGFLLANGF